MILEKRHNCFVGHGAHAVTRLERTKTTYHRFVKTTPNPKATKNSKGELVGPLPPPPPPLDVCVGEGRADVSVATKVGDNEFGDIVDVGERREVLGREGGCSGVFRFP